MPSSLLDALIAEPEFSERHECEVGAAPAATYAAIREVTALAVRPLVPLMAVRTLPVAIRHPRRVAGTIGEGFQTARSRPVLDQFLARGFVALAEEPGREYVAGAVGRFWSLAGSAPVALAGREGFLAFSEPGYAKVVFNFAVEPLAPGSLVLTETRVTTTSEQARRSFARYWQLILPGSALIRRSWLAAIRRRAERG